MRSFCAPRPIRTVCSFSSRSSSFASPRKMISLAIVVRPLFSRLRALSIGALRLFRRFRSVALGPLPDGARQALPDTRRTAQRDGVVGIAFPGRLVGQIDGFVVARGLRGYLRAGVAQDLVRFGAFDVDRE